MKTTATSFATVAAAAVIMTCTAISSTVATPIPHARSISDLREINDAYKDSTLPQNVNLGEEEALQYYNTPVEEEVLAPGLTASSRSSSFSSLNEEGMYEHLVDALTRLAESSEEETILPRSDIPKLE